jgi:hypothetical protein
MTTCPFCGRDPFVYVDIGVGCEAVAVDCCELGDAFFRGAREPITGDVVIDPDTFRELGSRIVGMAGELEAYRAKFGELETV